MIIFNLRCEHGHQFEGWFASSHAFEEQCEQGLVQCPVCNTTQVQKGLNAPRLNLSGAKEPAGMPVARHAEPEEHITASKEQVLELQGHIIAKMREFLRTTENVGDRFAQEARDIHYGLSPERAIRGVTTPQERDELRSEGIDTFSMPIPAGLDEPLQ